MEYYYKWLLQFTAEVGIYRERELKFQKKNVKCASKGASSVSAKENLEVDVLDCWLLYISSESLPLGTFFRSSKSISDHINSPILGILQTHWFASSYAGMWTR